MSAHAARIRAAHAAGRYAGMGERMRAIHGAKRALVAPEYVEALALRTVELRRRNTATYRARQSGARLPRFDGIDRTHPLPAKYVETWPNVAEFAARLADRAAHEKESAKLSSQINRRRTRIREIDDRLTDAVRRLPQSRSIDTAERLIEKSRANLATLSADQDRDERRLAELTKLAERDAPGRNGASFAPAPTACLWRAEPLRAERVILAPSRPEHRRRRAAGPGVSTWADLWTSRSSTDQREPEDVADAETEDA
jgi:hypothetical protein